MKRGEGVLYATGMGIVIYNFRRDDQSVYSEPGFALHTPKANAGMSIISEAPFQDVGFGYMTPPFVGSKAYWFPHTWFPNFVPMVLEQASDHFRHIAMFSHNNSNLSFVPVFSDEQGVANNYERYSFTTGALYDEHTSISVLLEKLITDGGRYTKYHPNVMLALFASHYMLDTQPDQVSGGGLEESKCDEFKVVASTSATPAELGMICSGVVTSEELRVYADAHKNRQPFASAVSAPVQYAHYQRTVDDAIAASQDNGDLQALDAHLEHIRIYEANILEAEHRSLQDMQYESGSYDVKPGGESALHPEADPDVFIDDCLGDSDDDDVPQPPPMPGHRPPPPPPPSGGTVSYGLGPFVRDKQPPDDDGDVFIEDGDGD